MFSDLAAEKPTLFLIRYREEDPSAKSWEEGVGRGVSIPHCDALILTQTEPGSETPGESQMDSPRGRAEPSRNVGAGPSV